jgi:hypothetical protein
MNDKLLPIGPINLEALDEYLLADHSPDDCTGLSGRRAGDGICLWGRAATSV